MKRILGSTYLDCNYPLIQEIEQVKDKVNISRKAKIKLIKFKVVNWLASHIM